MQSNLHEQLAAARAVVKAHADNQQKLSQAQAKAGGEARRLEKLKVVAVEAAEQAAQVGALFHMGEATDKEVKQANAEAHDAMVAAGGADHAIKRLNREAEPISERYLAGHPAAVAAQEDCNRLRAAILLESADRAAAQYLAAANDMQDKLVKLLGHNEALKRVEPSMPFTPRYPQPMVLPAYPSLPAFQPSTHWSLTLPVSDPAQLSAAADAVLRELGTNGKPL